MGPSFPGEPSYNIIGSTLNPCWQRKLYTLRLYVVLFPNSMFSLCKMEIEPLLFPWSLQSSNLSAMFVNIKMGWHNERKWIMLLSLSATRSTQNKDHWNISIFRIILLCIQYVCSWVHSVPFCKWLFMGRVVLPFQEYFESSNFSYSFFLELLNIFCPI